MSDSDSMMASFRRLQKGSNLSTQLGSRGCGALVEHATKGKTNAEKVALRRYLHNIKLKIMLNVYELLFGILI